MKNLIEQAPQSKTLENSEQSITEKTWLTGREICNLLRISNRTLQNYRDKRIIPFSQIGRKIYYKYSDINKFLEVHHIRPNYMKGGEQ